MLHPPKMKRSLPEEMEVGIRAAEAGVAGVAPWKPVLRKDVLSSVLEYLQSVTKQISKEIKLRWLSL